MKEYRQKYPIKPHAYRGISLEQLMGLTRPPKVVPLYQYKGAKGEIEVLSRGLTMVLSREVNTNVMIAADIAVSIAKRNPDRPVWYVNTFAGIELMQHAMEGARRNNSLPEIVPSLVREEGEGSPAGTLHHATLQQHEGLDPRVRRDDTSESIEDNHPLPPALERRGDSIGVLPNLHYFEIPIGQWNVEALAAALSGREYSHTEEKLDDRSKQPDDKSVNEETDEKADTDKAPAPIVIVNSFEYSPLNRGGKCRMARELLEVMDAFNMSLVVFTQEMRLEFEAGVAGRGSVGLLCGRAERVARMADAFEHLIRSRKSASKRLNQEDRATIHEAQMRAPSSGPSMVTIKNPDGSEEHLEMYGSPDRIRSYVIENLLLE